MIYKKLIVPALGLMAVTGCTMMPSYQRPTAPVRDTWPSAYAATNLPSVGTEAAELERRAFFNDPRLQSLLALSLENNRDLRIAALRVEQSRAQYRIQRSALFPEVDAGGSAIRQRTPGSLSITGEPRTFTTYDLSLGASYELDLFGRIRSLKEETLQRYLALEETRKSVQIALVSEVASQYLTLLQLEDSRNLARQTLEAVQSSYELNERSFKAGVASELDLRTAETQVQTARVNLTTFEQLLAQAHHALEVLVGQPIPGDLPAGQLLDEQQLLSDLPIGLPSEVLQRRPDILAAEHNLRAANADIGAARAAFFPRILLTGSAGTVSTSLSDLFTGPSAAWTFAPQISVPIFQGGRNKANLDATKIGKQIEIANYEKAIQSAFREVADALTVRSYIHTKLEAQALLVQAQQKRFDLTNARYRQGVDSYVEVLLAQQDLYIAQQNYLQFQAARLLNAVTLYRSLGGGWTASQDAGHGGASVRTIAGLKGSPSDCRR